MQFRRLCSCAAARRIELLQQAAATLNHRWGEGTAQIRCTEEYRNMKEKMDEHLQLVEKARLACLAAGVTPHVIAARGGTDGARLTYAGLPCPNLGLGGWAYHSPYEHITQEAMEQVTAILRELIFCLPKQGAYDHALRFWGCRKASPCRWIVLQGEAFLLLKQYLNSAV